MLRKRTRRRPRGRRGPIWGAKRPRDAVRRPFLLRPGRPGRDDDDEEGREGGGGEQRGGSPSEACTDARSRPEIAPGEDQKAFPGGPL